MVSPLLGSLASTIGRAMAATFLDATLTRDAVPASPAYDPSDPPAPTQTTYACKAIQDNFSKFELANSLVQANDSKILILAHSISIVPVTGDRVTIRSKTFSVIKVDTDPAMAVWVCQGRA